MASITPATPFNPVVMYHGNKRKTKARVVQPGQGGELGETNFNVALYNLKEALKKYAGTYEDVTRNSLAEEMENIPLLDTMNSEILAAALVLLFEVSRRGGVGGGGGGAEMTPQLFNEYIEASISPIEPDITMEATTHDALVSRLKADVLRYSRYVTTYREGR